MGLSLETTLPLDTVDALSACAHRNKLMIFLIPPYAWNCGLASGHSVQIYRYMFIFCALAKFRVLTLFCKLI